jgi:hypothetical protein
VQLQLYTELLEFPFPGVLLAKHLVDELMHSEKGN